MFASSQHSKGDTRSKTKATHNISKKRKKKAAAKKLLKQRKKGTTNHLVKTMSSWAESFTHAATWQLKHQVAYWKSRATALEYENKVLHDVIKSNHFGSARSSNVHIMKDKVNTSEYQHDDESAQSDSEDSELDEVNPENYYVDQDESIAEEYDDEEDLEVSEEFVAFLKENAKYKEDARLEREKLRHKMAQEEAENKLLHEPKIENIQTKEELYGDKWKKIAALEMSMQSDFIEKCDTDKPCYWPNIPFNFNY